MRNCIVVIAVALCLMGCPKPRQLNKIAAVKVIATCDTPGAPCTFEHVKEFDKTMFTSFKVKSEARRDANEAVAEDNVEVEFVSKVPVMGYMAGMNNDVFGDLQTMEVSHGEGLDEVETVYAWKMKIALDDMNQYELTMDFYGPPSS